MYPISCHSLFFFILLFFLYEEIFAIEKEKNTYISGENIAFVNMAKLYAFSIEIKNVEKILEQKKQNTYKKINVIEEKILYKKEMQKKESTSLTSTEKKALSEEITFLEDELKNELYEKKNELMDYEKEISKKILIAIYLEIRRYVKKESIQIVIDKSKAYLYDNQQNNLDITDVILKRLAKKSQKINFD